MINKRLNKGFTLIEMALVLTIIGIIIAGAGKLGTASIEIARLKATKTQMATIKDALQLYYETNNRLPCPADGSLAVSHANFGKETYSANACTPATGMLDEADVYVGVVPTRSLNLPDSYMVDGWSNRITYSVDKDCLSAAWGTTSPNYCNSDATLLSVVDNNSAHPLTVNSAGTAIATVAYVVVSHGKNGIGAWNQVGTRVTTPCPSTLSAYEMDNANMTSGCAATTENGQFRDNTTNDGTVAANYFDDIVAWQTDDRMYYIKSCKASGTSC